MIWTRMTRLSLAQLTLGNLSATSPQIPNPPGLQLPPTTLRRRLRDSEIHQLARAAPCTRKQVRLRARARAVVASHSL